MVEELNNLEISKGVRPLYEGVIRQKRVNQLMLFFYIISNIRDANY
jgi:hypothetical protein